MKHTKDYCSWLDLGKKRKSFREINALIRKKKPSPPEEIVSYADVLCGVLIFKLQSDEGRASEGG